MITTYKAITGLADFLLPSNLATALRRTVRTRRDRRTQQEVESRKMNWLSNAGKGQALHIEIEPGVILAAYPDSELCRLVYVGQYELAERQFVCRFLRPGDNFVDVGANVGLYSLHAARAIGPRGIVHAFEPCSRTFSRLVDNIERNRLGNVRAHRVALSDSCGQLSMFTSSDGFDAWNSAGMPTMGTDFKEESVPCETWDSFAKSENLVGRVALMKVDIEGWESHFLAGGREALSASDAPAILIELNDAAARTAGGNVGLLQEQLREFGYALHQVAPGGSLQSTAATFGNLRSINVVALKNRHLAEARLRERPIPRNLR